MKRIYLLLAMSSLVALGANAQTVTGSGTPGFVPQFTGSSTVGNSNIFQASNGNIGIGSTFPPVPLYVFNSNPVGPPGFQPIALWVESTANGSTAVYGVTDSQVAGFGVNGEARGPQANGVIGNFLSANAQGGGGVIGQTSATSGFSYGARGDSLGTTGTAVGVFGSAQSPDGWAAYFVNRAGGNIMIGVVGQNSDVPVFRVDGTGRVFADGGFRPNGADFAESMAVTGERSEYSPGDLLVIDSTANRHVALAQLPYSTLVAGIYSTKPGLLGTTLKVDEAAPQNEVPLAVVGIVPCKVTAENGPIAAGDLLVTSPVPGHAMKGTDRNRMLGAVVGKALEPLQKGTGVIHVLVTLQ